MNTAYAVDRMKKPQLIFRYKVRARIAGMAAKKYLGSSGPFRILDFGAAEGSALLEIRHLLPSGTYVGVEYSEELLQHVRNLPADTRVVKGDVMNLSSDIKNEPYDIVTALAVLEHLCDPLKAAQRAASALRPGGIFIATCPVLLWDAISQRLWLVSGEHETNMNKKRMVDLVQKSGLEPLSYEKFMWAPIGILSYLKMPVSPSFSLRLDAVIRKLKIFNWLFVNQCIIARKPLCIR